MYTCAIEVSAPPSQDSAFPDVLSEPSIELAERCHPKIRREKPLGADGVDPF